MNSFLIILQTFLGVVALLKDNIISNQRIRKYSVFILLVGMLITLLFQIKSQRQEDFKNTVDGTLKSPTSIATSTPVLILGGTSLAWGGDPNAKQFTFANGDYFQMKMVNGQISITTQIRDSSGHLIGDIENNHWIIFAPQLILDRNFNSNSLEIVDLDGNVTFQIQISGNEVRLSGFYYSNSDVPKEHLQFIGPYLEGASTPLFRYPSIENPHILSTTGSYATTSGEFIFGIPPEPLKIEN